VLECQKNHEIRGPTNEEGQRTSRSRASRLTPEGCSHMVLHNDKVEIANSRLSERETNSQEDRSQLRSQRGWNGAGWHAPRHLFVRAFAVIVVLVLSLGWPSDSAAYAVLAHEAIIDSAWDTNIRPLLLKRFPGATPEELKEAHGYAYGGAIIQDMGYYPHGSFFFSDLTHYVRSGDFVLALLHDSKDLDGYAFALGALAHYASDNEGHPIATNRAVPLLYPKLKTKYGDSVTYEQDRLAHVKTEFGFDVLEVAHGRYAPDSYHDFIGFGVSVSLLEQAFQKPTVWI